MPIYRYRAKTAAAETVTGQISAADQQEAIDLISQQGLIPVLVEEGTSATPKRGPTSSRKITHKDVYIFSRELAGLIKAGVPILKALNILSQQQDNLVFKNIIVSFAQGIKNGRTLSECLSHYPYVFSAFYVAMVRV